MGQESDIGFRFLIFEDDDTITRLSNDLGFKYRLGRKAAPQFARKTIKVAYAECWREGHKLTSLSCMLFQLWHFNGRGYSKVVLPPNLMSPQTNFQIDGDIVDISMELKMRVWRCKNVWEPTPEQYTAVTDLLFPPPNRH